MFKHSLPTDVDYVLNTLLSSCLRLFRWQRSPPPYASCGKDAFMKTITETTLFSEVLDLLAASNPHRLERRPGAIRLREENSCLARFDFAENSCCELFENGYAVYDAGCRRTVLWVLDCETHETFFTPLTDAEKQYMTDHYTYNKEELGAMPWYYPILLCGEAAIEANLSRPSSSSIMQGYVDEEGYQEKNGHSLSMSAHFESPEEALMRKESFQEALAAMTERQREVFLYNWYGYKQDEISAALGISQQMISKHLTAAKDIFQKILSEGL